MYYKEPYSNYQIWNRVIFPISKCSGTVNQTFFREELLFNRVGTQDIKFVFALLEFKTHNFSNIRLFFRVKIIFIVIALFCILASVLSFTTLDILALSIVLLILGVLFFSLYCFCVTNVFKNLYKQDYKKLYSMLLEINKKIFEPKRLYLMVNPDLDMFVLYIVPPLIQLSLQINNFITSNSSKDNKSSSNGKTLNRTFSDDNKRNRSKDSHDILEISDIKVEDIIRDYLNQADDNASNGV